MWRRGRGRARGGSTGGKRRRRCAAFFLPPDRGGAPEPRIDGLFRSTPSGPRGPASGSSSRRRPGNRHLRDVGKPLTMTFRWLITPRRARGRAHRSSRAVGVRRRARGLARARWRLVPRVRVARLGRPVLGRGRRSRGSSSRSSWRYRSPRWSPRRTPRRPSPPRLPRPPPSPPPRALPQPRPLRVARDALERVLDRAAAGISGERFGARARAASSRRRTSAAARPARPRASARARRRRARATSGCPASGARATPRAAASASSAAASTAAR